MELRETVLNWVIGPETAFLLGAGCSLCAHKPLIGRLTERIIPRLDDRIQELFTRLRGTAGRDATIEDLMTHLLRRRDVFASLKSSEDETPSLSDINVAINLIRFRIVEEIKDDWQPSQYHQRFLRRIGGGERWPRDIFTLNYDTVLEASLEALAMPYTDGFVGAENAYFEPALFAHAAHDPRPLRVYKLHGSINWIRDSSDVVRRKPVASITTETERIVVYPSEQKYLQTKFGVYETMMSLFRERLRRNTANNRLVCLGYSFNDEHVNEVLIDATKQELSNLTVYAFLGPENYADGDDSDHRLRLTRIEARCPGRFNAFVGERFYIGDAMDDNLASKLLAMNLWKFENLVMYIAGGDE
jgi:hypothetical protein